jgi:nitrous oxidase accessory protein NosD
MNYIMGHDLGISLKDGASDNTIYHNNLIGNLQHAHDACMNLWDLGQTVGGNYWDNYAGVDLNGDGLGDTIYKIPGGLNEDRYPLMNYAKIE